MKIQLHIPTEQYGFIGVEYESDGEIAYAEAAREYKLFADAFKPQPMNSLPEPEFNTFIDRMLAGDTNHVETYNQMSPEQQAHVQVIKKAVKRANYKINNSKE